MPSRIKSLNKREQGITGLETAIILIAFVIVASVLSYVVISAGLFSSQKAKSAVNAGLAQTGATIELKGNVTAELDGDADAVTKVYFTVGVVPGGSAVDLSPNPLPVVGVTNNPKLIVSYSDSTQQVASLYWTMNVINANNGDNMLDPGELALITVFLDQTNYNVDTDLIRYMPNALKAGTTFSLSLTPPDGSVLPIERTIPSGVQAKDGEVALINLY